MNTSVKSDVCADPKPKRNPLERLLVWGGISLAIVVIITEGTARFTYTMSLNALQARVQDDDAEDSKPLTVEEAETLVVGFPQISRENEVITYRFKGLIKEFGAIHLKHDEDQVVLALETDVPPEIVEETVELGPDGDPAALMTHEAEEHSESQGEAGAAGGPGGVGAGGGRNFDPMQFDKDADGKISLEEAPDRMKETFSEIDTNGDGFADAEEFAARRAARQREREATGGEAGGGGDRPQRPAGEGDAPATPAAEEKPAEPAPAVNSGANPAPPAEPAPAAAAKPAADPAPVAEPEPAKE